MSQPGRSQSIVGTNPHAQILNPHQFPTMCQGSKPINTKTALISPISSPNYQPMSPLPNHMSPNPSVLSPGRPTINQNVNAMSPNSNPICPSLICPNVLSPSSNILSPIYNSNVSPLTGNASAASPMPVGVQAVEPPTLTALGPAMSPVRNIFNNTSNLVLQVGTTAKRKRKEVKCILSN